MSGSMRLGYHFLQHAARRPQVGSLTKPSPWTSLAISRGLNYVPQSKLQKTSGIRSDSVSHSVNQPSQFLFSGYPAQTSTPPLVLLLPPPNCCTAKPLDPSHQAIVPVDEPLVVKSDKRLFHGPGLEHPKMRRRNPDGRTRFFRSQRVGSSILLVGLARL